MILDQRVLALYDSGYTTETAIHGRIVCKVQVSYDTIKRKVNKSKQEKPLSIPRKTRSDTFLNDDTWMEIEEYIEENLFAKPEEIIKDLDYTISTRTMQRTLKKMDLIIFLLRNAFI